jgi:hypothetical protein
MVYKKNRIFSTTALGYSSPLEVNIELEKAGNFLLFFLSFSITF